MRNYYSSLTDQAYWHCQLSDKICVVLVCKSVMRSTGYMEFFAGVPQIHTERQNGGQDSGIHYYLWPFSKLTEPATPESPHCGGAASVREAFISAALSAPTPAPCW